MKKLLMLLLATSLLVGCQFRDYSGEVVEMKYEPPYSGMEYTVEYGFNVSTCTYDSNPGLKMINRPESYTIVILDDELDKRVELTVDKATYESLSVGSQFDSTNREE